MKSVSITLGPEGTLQAFLPGTDAEGHHVNIPLTVEGLAILRRVLIKRQTDPEPRVGKDSAPTQAQIEAWLKAAPPPKVKVEEEEVEVDLEELGL